MLIKLFQTLGISLAILFLNYIASIYSNLGSAQSILLDSLIDVIFPVISIVSVYQSGLDRTLSLIQLSVILCLNLYFVFDRLTKPSLPNRDSSITLITMLISFCLSVYCSIATSKLTLETSNLSIYATAAHFQIDVIAKACLIVISLVGIFKIKHKERIIKVLDIGTIVLIAYIAFTKLISIVF